MDEQSHSERRADNFMCYACTEMKNKIGLAQELRDSIDMYQRDLDISKFFDALLPCFINLLQTGKPSFVSNSADHVSSHTSTIMAWQLGSVTATWSSSIKLTDTNWPLASTQSLDTNLTPLTARRGSATTCAFSHVVAALTPARRE